MPRVPPHIRPEQDALRPRADAMTSLFFNQLMNTLPDYVYFKDRQSRFLKINQAMVGLFHLNNTDEAVGLTDHNFFAPEFADQKRADEQQVMRTGVGIVNKEEFNSAVPDGDRWALTTKLPLYGPGGDIVGIFGISHDITEAKIARETLQKNHQQMANEIKVACELQRELIASDIQNVRATLSGTLRFSPRLAYRYEPCEHLTGDSLQTIPLGPNRFALLISDVMGHGIKAALVSTLLRGLVTTNRPSELTPATMLGLLNNRLCRILDQPFMPRFITAVYAVVDVSCGRIEIASAGHPWPFMAGSAGGPVSKVETGPALGLMTGAEFPTVICHPAPRDRLLFFTDACLEEPDKAGDEFGPARLSTVLSRTHDIPMENALDAVVAELRAHAGGRMSLQDDLCALLLGF